jgi:hypothetical protein
MSIQTSLYGRADLLPLSRAIFLGGAIMVAMKGTLVILEIS